MSSQAKSVSLVAILLLAALVQSAPTDTETSTKPMSAEASTSADKESSTTEASAMAVSSAQDQPHLQNTSFTCFNRSVGYYADTESGCKVYHFCMLGSYNGEQVYQRISYLCLSDTIFDQQALDCVDGTKILAPCAESAKYYDESNTVLRKAIIGSPAAETEKRESEMTTATETGHLSTDTSSTTTTTITDASVTKAT